MRNQRKQPIIFCLLCMMLLFTMGMDSRTGNVSQRTTSHPNPNTVTKEQKIEYKESLVDLLPADNIPVAPIQSEESSSPAAAPVTTNDAPNNAQQAQTAETETAYVVTASYLNVREEADADSRIVDVVTNGAVLQVMNQTDTGWLALKDGGFVNARYVELINGEEKQVADTSGPLQPNKPSPVINSKSGLTEEHVAKIVKGTALEDAGLEKAVVEIEQKYGINSYFTIAVMELESGRGQSQLAKTKNNLFGLNALDGDAYQTALSFKTKGDSVEQFGQIISDFYIAEGLVSVDKVASKYCAANSNWPKLVKSIMNSDYEKVA